MAKCKEHPGRDAVPGTIFGNHYCKECTEQIAAAQTRTHRHVEPKDCFVIYTGSKNGWISISDFENSTGCAHWVAHQLGIRNTIRGEGCAKGFKFKVRRLIEGFRKIDREKEDVKAGDVWVNRRQNHCGLVVRVEDDGKKILIRHCSSGQGGVVENYFPSYLKDGDFYRH